MRGLIVGVSTAATIPTGAPGSLPGRWRVFAFAAAAAAVAVAAFLAWTGFVEGGATLTSAVDDIGETVAAMVAALSCAFAARRSSGRSRLAWRLLAASAASWGLGQAIVSFYEIGLGTAVPFPSAADAGFLAAMPLAFAGVLAFPLNPSRAVPVTRLVLDGGILTFSLLFVGAALGLGNVSSTSPVTPLAQLVGIAHPLGGLLMIAVILWPIRRAGFWLGGPMLLLLGGLAANSVPDTAFAYWIANGSDGAFGKLLGAGRVLAYLLIALAALWPPSSRPTPHERPVALWQVMIPWVALLGVAITAGVLAVTGHPFAPMLAALGGPLALLLVLSELQSRRAETQFRNQKALLEQIIAKAPFGIARHRADMTLIEVHRTVGSLVEGETRASSPSTMADFLPPEEISRAFEKLQQLRDGSAESIEGESPGLRADGTKGGWWQWSVHKVRKEGGSLDYFLVMFADTSAEHEAKEAAMANLAGLERLSELKSEFVSMVSHEFRTALTGIQGFSEVMRDQAITTDEMKEFAGDINSDAMRLNRMITELLDLDRMESGRMTLHRGPVDLNNTVREAVERAQVSGSKHVIKTDLEPALPVVMGDADRLFQVVANLLSNAGKYSPEGAEVLVTSRVQDGNVQISVRDHGQGIPPEFLDRLFGRYERFESNPKKQVIGTGLGLAITRQIVEMHKGRIWVESMVGVGSVFHFTVPVDARQEAKLLETGEVRQTAGLADQELGPA